jgi:hypothetical protein
VQQGAPRVSLFCLSTDRVGCQQYLLMPGLPRHPDPQRNGTRCSRVLHTTIFFIHIFHITDEVVCNRMSDLRMKDGGWSSTIEYPSVEPGLCLDLDGRGGGLWTTPLRSGTGDSGRSAAPAALPLSTPPRPTADFNGDGAMDLLWRDYTTGRNSVWLMNGTTRQTEVTLMAVPDVNWRIQGVNDFNQDGQADILWQNAATGAVVFWFMNGTTRLSDTWVTGGPDLTWQIQATGDLNGDRQPDILWRNDALGMSTVWLMQGTTFQQSVTLPQVLGRNLSMQGTGDFNADGQTDILWRNYLTGETTVWLMNGTTRLGLEPLSFQVSDVNWQIQAVDDFNRDGQPDIIWRQVQSGDNYLWLMNGTTVSQAIALPAQVSSQSQVKLQTPLMADGPIALENLIFSGLEGDTGSLQIRLAQAPTTAVTLTLSGDTWLTVDADGRVQNGTQTTITFTPQNWNQLRTIGFVAEVDDAGGDRPSNTLRYSLSGGLTGSGTYNLGTIANTHTPDLTRFNIDLDFRNDADGFWTPARRAIAQRAASDWSALIANEWTGLTLNAAVPLLDRGGDRPFSFTSRRYVDDLVVFVNPYPSPSANGEPALGGPDYGFGGWSANQPMPRVGQVAISSQILANQPDRILYQVVAHEIGHTLGLIGLNWTSALLQQLSNPATATFQGPYSRAANGGVEVPLQSQTGGDFYHPGDGVRSIMSYGWIYNPETTRPTAIDAAFLADSGYRVPGLNA